eukprot:COSAG02_NODE_34354_length_485_cov_1.049223_2_plen_40_part_01
MKNRIAAYCTIVSVNSAPPSLDTAREVKRPRNALISTALA